MWFSSQSHLAPPSSSPLAWQEVPWSTHSTLWTHSTSSREWHPSRTRKPAPTTTDLGECGEERTEKA